jgi:lysophospholipase L1-like esterase
VRVRRNAPRFPAPDGPRSGAVGKGKPLRMLAIGDSIIVGVGARTMENALVGRVATRLADRLEARIHWTAVGSIGATTAKVHRQLLPRVEAEPFDLIMVSAGVNDITALATRARWRTALDGLLSDLGAHSPRAVMALVGIPPLGRFPLLPQPLRSVIGVRGGTFDAVARAVVAHHPRVTYVPVQFTAGPDRFSEDGFHPSETSYVEFGESMADALHHRWSARSAPSP